MFIWLVMASIIVEDGKSKCLPSGMSIANQVFHGLPPYRVIKTLSSYFDKVGVFDGYSQSKVQMFSYIWVGISSRQRQKLVLASCGTGQLEQYKFSKILSLNASARVGYCAEAVHRWRGLPLSQYRDIGASRRWWGERQSIIKQKPGYHSQYIGTRRSGQFDILPSACATGLLLFELGVFITSFSDKDDQPGKIAGSDVFFVFHWLYGVDSRKACITDDRQPMVSALLTIRYMSRKSWRGGQEFVVGDFSMPHFEKQKHVARSSSSIHDIADYSLAR